MKKDFEKFRKLLRKNGYPSLGAILRRRQRTIADYLAEKNVTDTASALALLNTLSSSTQDVSFEDDFFQALDQQLPDDESGSTPEQVKEMASTPSLDAKKKKSKTKSADAPILENSLENNTENDDPAEVEID